MRGVAVAPGSGEDVAVGTGVAVLVGVAVHVGDGATVGVPVGSTSVVLSGSGVLLGVTSMVIAGTGVLLDGTAVCVMVGIGVAVAGGDTQRCHTQPTPRLDHALIGQRVLRWLRYGIPPPSSPLTTPASR